MNVVGYGVAIVPLQSVQSFVALKCRSLFARSFKLVSQMNLAFPQSFNIYYGSYKGVRMTCDCAWIACNWSYSSIDNIIIGRRWGFRNWSIRWHTDLFSRRYFLVVRFPRSRWAETDVAGVYRSPAWWYLGNCVFLYEERHQVFEKINVLADSCVPPIAFVYYRWWYGDVVGYP